VGCLSRGQISNVSYAYKKTGSADSMFRVFNALGQISFAFAGHAVALEIQATIPSTPERPSKVPMWKGAVGAYFINAICYFPVALIGYWAFGQDVDDNVLMNLQKPAWLIASANLMVVIHVIGSYQVRIHICFLVYIYVYVICMYVYSS
jgi:amino acid permease